MKDSSLKTEQSALSEEQRKLSNSKKEIDTLIINAVSTHAKASTPKNRNENNASMFKLLQEEVNKRLKGDINTPVKEIQRRSILSFKPPPT